MICISKVIHYFHCCFWKRLKNHLGPAKFLSVPWLALEATLKKNDVKLELFTNIDMSLMVEKGIKRGICHFVNRYVKTNKKQINKTW